MILFEQNTFGRIDLTDNARLVRFPIKNAEGDVWLAGCANLRSLPDGLTVRDGSLILEFSGIQELPRGLYVKRILRIENTGIRSIPSDTKVGSIWASKGKVRIAEHHHVVWGDPNPYYFGL